MKRSREKSLNFFDTHQIARWGMGEPRSVQKANSYQ